MSATLFMDLPNQFNSPASAAKDDKGNIYFTSPNLHNDILVQAGEAAEAPCIGRIAPDNTLTTWYRFTEADMFSGTRKAAPMGLAFGPDGHLYVADLQLWFDGGEGNSRLLRITVENGEATGTDVVATGFMFPNGVAWRDDKLYVTETILKAETGEYTISGLYQFDLAELDPQIPIKIPRYTNNDNRDPHLFDRFVSNGKLGFGANGIAIDDDGNLYIGVMEDGIIVKTVVDDQQNKAGNSIFSQGFIGPDGFVWDSKRQRFYMADLFMNAVFSIDPGGMVTTLAQNADTGGANGDLDAPSEVIVRGNELIVMNFDAVFDSDEMVNRSSGKPFTLSAIPL
ncbi:hypothetical protein [Parendozoicomonas haliclonae]|uniref:SMP-30/Gluconolaconase/LRE-like region n=1 Tax=Parendozoicomonas haliclonae TaxID=1960125 RepID=A0A1X7ARB1_9GAMM|nr:hypothetical protein [Parendozoicomonas haliclonae]SMA50620.1 SMP-30/Gluconolaconase/LRE-like region [Parendozoicomonas haliclonae]